MDRSAMDESACSVNIPADGAVLEGDLVMPEGANAIVAFAHGSGSSRHSPRNRQVAEALREVRLATLLFDLLESDEEAEDLRTAKLRFDIQLLGQRLVAAVDWLASDSATASLRVGLFGASTGAAAALVAAARRPQRVQAIVSRGGRPDLAGDELSSVKAPTLMIVGGNDPVVIQLNNEALVQMQAETRLEIVEGAGHLFEESGTLDRVAALAREWFARFLVNA